MEAFVGKFESTGADRTGVDEYLAATMQTDKKDRYMSKHTQEIKLEGSTMTLTSGWDHEGETPVTVVMKIGEQTEIDIPQVGKTLITVTFENNIFKSIAEIHGVAFETKSYFDGDVLVVESTINEKTMTDRMKRV